MDLNELVIVESPEEDFDSFLEGFGDHAEHILFECGPDCEPFVYVHEIFTDPDLGPGQISRSTCWDEPLDYMLSECMAAKRDGFYVAEDNTLHHTRGDGWTTDDDSELEGGEIRPARWHELRMVLSFWEALSWFPTQLKLHWLHARRFYL